MTEQSRRTDSSHTTRLAALVLLTGATALAGCDARSDTDLAATAGPVQAAQALTPTPVRGLADLHLHMFAEEAFAGGWLHGSATGTLQSCDGGLPPSSHARVRQDLRELLKLCPSGGGGVDLSSIPIIKELFEVGGAAASELLAKSEATDGDTGLHLLQREPIREWPRWDSIAHQQSHRDFLQQAFRGGLKLAVISAVSNGFLCSALPATNRKRACDEMADVELQLKLARDFARSNSSWVEIAEGPAEARRIIEAGKLALVLSIEASKLFGAKDWKSELARFHALGVRTLQPVHQLDNRFGGAALHQPIFHVAQFLENCHIDTDCGRTAGGVTLGFDVDSGCRNVKGLSAEGRELIKEMMGRGMLIDIAHMSERSVADALTLTQDNGYYPVYISHGHPREVMGPDQEKNEKTTPAWIMRGLRHSGGVFGLRTFHDETREYDRSEVPNTCHGSSRSFAQALGFAVKGLKVAVALGTDFNGFIQQVRPRFGDLGACSAGFRAEGDAQAKAEASAPAGRLGTDYDEKGLAHIGLVPDFLRDLEKVGASTSSLQDSAEAFLRMWERATSPRAGMADAAADLDTSGVAPYVAKATREASYPKECGQSYTPASKAPGQSCRFNGECTTARCSALLCGAVPGRCS
jgi:microsomal dipeptidase-like Zn-dependent dipeptidase